MSNNQLSQAGKGNGPSGKSSKGNGGGQGKSNWNNPNRFKGACEELKDHVYTVGDAKQSDRYTKTTERILDYILGNFDQGCDVRTSLEELKEVDMELYKPEQPEGSMSEVDKMVLAAEVKDYVGRKFTFNDNMNKAYALHYTHCDPVLHSQIGVPCKSGFTNRGATNRGHFTKNDANRGPCQLIRFP